MFSKRGAYYKITIGIFCISTIACGEEVIEKEGGFAYDAPSGWTVIEGGKFSDYQICLGDKIGSFHPNVNVVQQEWDGSLGDYVNKNIAAIRKQGGDKFEVMKVLPGLTNKAEPFVLVVHQGASVNPNNGEPLRNAQAYFYGSRRKKTVINFSIPASASEDQDKIFYELLKTFIIFP